MAGVSGPSLVSTIQTEIERARQDLKGVDENLRRLTGRDFNDPNQRPDLRRVRLTSGSRDDEPPAKRRPPGGVFARLGAVVLDQQHPEPRGRPRGDLRGEHRGGEPRGEPHADLRLEVHGEVRARRVQEVVENEEKVPKPSLASSVARPQLDSKSRSEAAAELTKDRASRDRNRRMFGALLGTLKRFKNDEAKQKDKEEQRAAIERKLEEKGRAEKEELRRERLELFNQRKERQAQIRRLTIKMARVKEHEVWEAHQMKLAKFIRTESSPAIFWAPRQHNTRTTNLVRTTHDKISRELEQDRLRMKEELDEILGSRGEDREGAEVGEEEEETFVHRGVRSQVAKQGEGGGTDSLDNCPDLLDYEAEEGELVYDEADLSGKDEDDTERMVVQVDGRGEGGRKVEIVASQPEEGVEEGKSGAGLGNDSEKENEGRRKDKDRNREEKHKDRDRKNRDRGREKDRHRDKEDVYKGKDRSTGRERDRSRPKDSYRDLEREKSKERPKSKDSSEGLDNESDTVVHIKIEKDDDSDVKEGKEILKIIKEEKADNTPGAGRKGGSPEQTPVTIDDVIVCPATTADIKLPPPIVPAESTTSCTLSSAQPTSTASTIVPPLPSSAPSALPQVPSPQPFFNHTCAGSDDGNTTVAGKGNAMPNDNCTASDTRVGVMDSSELSPEKQPEGADCSMGPEERAQALTDMPSANTTKISTKGKLQKEEKKKMHKKDKVKKTIERKKDKASTKRDSGSSDDSSSGSSDSSSDSSESDSSESDSSSSSSSDSGSSSDSESDSSFTSSSRSDSDSGREKREKRRKKGRRSRSDDSSSESETEGKRKKKQRIGEKKRDRREGGKISVSKGKEDSHSEDDKTKKMTGKTDKVSEGRKGKEESRKSKELARGRERDLEHRKTREVAKKGDRSGSREKKRNRSRDQRKERSRSREDRRGSSRKDRR